MTTGRLLLSSFSVAIHARCPVVRSCVFINTTPEAERTAPSPCQTFMSLVVIYVPWRGDGRAAKQRRYERQRGNCRVVVTARKEESRGRCVWF